MSAWLAKDRRAPLLDDADRLDFDRAAFERITAVDREIVDLTCRDRCRDIPAGAVRSPFVRSLLPDAESFIVLPLVVGKAQLGLFYADRIFTAPEGVPPDETALIKALKAQVVAALAPA